MSSLAVIIMLAGLVSHLLAVPVKETTKKTHILCPRPSCPDLVGHYKQLGWVSENLFFSFHLSFPSLKKILFFPFEQSQHQIAT